MVRRVGRPLSVILCGGGTGGHLAPGVALCEHLERTEPGCQVTLLRTGRAVEDHVFRDSGIETVVMDLQPPGSGVLGRLRFVRQVWRQVAAIHRLMDRRPIDVMVGLGGFASVPGILAARLRGISVILLEQNVRPGKVNRLFGPLVDCVACSTLSAVEDFGSWTSRVRLEDTGNPLRDAVARAGAWRHLGSVSERRAEVGAGGRRVLLIMGGSQGARSINRAVIAALDGHRELSEKIYCVHIAGIADKETVRQAYSRSGWTARVSEFESDLPRLLAASDLVLARAGGTSVSELAAIGVPSFLVPYPGHRDRHQFANAGTLADRGAAVVLEEEELERGGLKKVFDCLFDEPRLRSMERAAMACSRLDGAERVVSLIRDAAAGFPREVVSQQRR